MRVVPAGELQTGVELLAAIAGEALATESEVRFDELYIGPLRKRVRYDLLVLLDSDGTDGRLSLALNEIHSD